MVEFFLGLFVGISICLSFCFGYGIYIMKKKDERAGDFVDFMIEKIDEETAKEDYKRYES